MRNHSQNLNTMWQPPPVALDCRSIITGGLYCGNLRQGNLQQPGIRTSGLLLGPPARSHAIVLQPVLVHAIGRPAGKHNILRPSRRLLAQPLPLPLLLMLPLPLPLPLLLLLLLLLLLAAAAGLPVALLQPAMAGFGPLVAVVDNLWS